MTLDVVGRNLTNFQSSHQFISAIADAMEAHDFAFFDCRVLHRDISVGNIILTDVHEGLLIDWDLCIKLDGDNDKPVARRPTQTGTWQFISARLLSNPSGGHTYCDDRESAFHVLLWTGLRYTKTDEAAPGSIYTPHNILQAFDERFVDPTGTELGGNGKKPFWQYRKLGILFTERPELDNLMAELASVFLVRYEQEPNDQEMTRMKKQLKKLDDANSEEQKRDVQEILVDSVAYRYQQRMDKLKRRGWLVDTIRKYFGMGQWEGNEEGINIETFGSTIAAFWTTIVTFESLITTSVVAFPNCYLASHFSMK
ncbi:hypothetical protein B0H34DRAFT_9169 [Crassisporium funariophilum]|nr:hypothetical protein B0H34DRAFT_9169 [Crassisporium funariophilum]